MTRIILASRSASRQSLLRGAGIPFDSQPTDIDEAAVKDAVLARGGTPADAAAVLAREKALALDAPEGALVIGADQVMEFEGRLYDKPASLEEAAARLAAMRGQTHYLRGGVALIRDGEVVFTHKDSAALTLRDLTELEIAAYLDEVGERVLATVGAYELEGPGVRLFSRVEGDYFTILGLSLLPLLGALRAEGALPW